MALVMGTNAGFCAASPSGDPNGGSQYDVDGYCNALKHTTPVGVTKITEIGWYCNNATEETNFEVAIYTHHVGNDKPDAIVGSKSGTNAKGTALGWKKVTGLNIAVTAETIYWIAYQVDNTATTTYIDTENNVSHRRSNDNASTLSDPWPAGSGENADQIHAVYAVYEAAGPDYTKVQVNIADAWKSASNVQINIGDVWKTVTKMEINIGDAWKTIFG